MADPLKIQFIATGAEGVESAANRVSGSLTGVGTSAEQASAKGGGAFGTLGGSVGKLAIAAGVAGAAIKTVGAAFGEFAEGEQMTVELQKFGVSAAEAAKQAELLYNIETFTGSKIEAARLYGEVTNGIGRSLRRYGIELSATSTQQERMNALLELGARGAAVQEAQATTLTGSWEIFKRKTVDVLGNAAGWVVEITGLNKALGWLNEKLFGVKSAGENAAKGLQAATPELEKSGKAAKLASEEWEELQKAIGATGKEFDAFAAKEDARRKRNDEFLDANADAEIAALERKKAEGKITEENFNKEKARIEGAQSVYKAEAAVEQATKTSNALGAYEDMARAGDTEAGRRAKAARDKEGLSPEESAAAQKNYLNVIDAEITEAKKAKAKADEDLQVATTKLNAARDRAEAANIEATRGPDMKRGEVAQGLIDDSLKGQAERAAQAKQEAEDAAEKRRQNIEKGFGSDEFRAAQDLLSAPDPARERQSDYDRKRGPSELDRFNNETRERKGGGAASSGQKAANAAEAAEAKLSSAFDAITSRMNQIAATADAAKAQASLASRTAGQGGEAV